MNTKSARSANLLLLLLVSTALVGCFGGSSQQPQQGSVVRSEPAYGPPPNQGTSDGGSQQGPAGPYGENTRDAVGTGDSEDGSDAYGGPSFEGYIDSNPQRISGGSSGNPASPDNSPSYTGLEEQPGASSGNRSVAEPEGDSESGDSNQAAPVSNGDLLSMPLINQRTGGGSYPSAYCGPTSVRMVLAHYGIHTEADEIALRDYGAGPMYHEGEGATHEGMAAALRHFGLNAQVEYGKNLSSLRSAVSAGHPVIVNLEGDYGPFYTNGHIVVVVGFTAAGDVIINDSAGGVQRTIPRRTFLNCWNGLRIEVSK